MNMLANKRLLIGVGCGLLAALLMLLYISDVRAQATSSREQAIAKYGGETVEVCVATCDIASGQTIGAGDVELRTWIVDLLPEGAITDLDDVVGSTAHSAILEREPISSAKIGGALSSVTVPDGLCAVTVESEDVLAVGGAIRSGSLVDVYATSGSSVQLLGQSVLVLETSGSGASDAEDASEFSFGDAYSRASVSWVTLAVEPESVSELIAASRSGSLYFALPGSQADAAEDADGSQAGSAEDTDESQADEGVSSDDTTVEGAGL